MKRFALMIALVTLFTCSPLASISYLQAEEGYADSEANTTEPMDQGEWVTDEPATTETMDDSADAPVDGEPYDAESDGGDDSQSQN